eukprot:SM007721S22524  [mRNA]  locus=s7721:23:704:- [translate_table: standard]
MAPIRTRAAAAAAIAAADAPKPAAAAREQLPLNLQTILSPRAADLRLVQRHPEVYEPCDDSFVLVDALLADHRGLATHLPALCVELGCGSGYVLASLALILGREAGGAQFLATDVSGAAVEAARGTLAAHGIGADIVHADLLGGLERRLAGAVDVLLVNPPYVPTPDEEVGRGGIAA